MKKKLLLFTVLLIGSLVVAGCGNSKQNNKNEADSTELSGKTSENVEQIFRSPTTMEGETIEISGVIEGDVIKKDKEDTVFYYVNTKEGKMMLAFSDTEADYKNGDKIHIKGEVDGQHMEKDGKSIPLIEAVEIVNAY